MFDVLRQQLNALVLETFDTLTTKEASYIRSETARWRDIMTAPPALRSNREIVFPRLPSLDWPPPMPHVNRPGAPAPNLALRRVGAGFVTRQPVGG